MPELPEVETVKRSLEKQLVGHKITSFLKLREKLRYILDPELEKKTKNTIILMVTRIAKYLVIKLSNNNSLIFHLGMTGRLTLKSINYSFEKHDHVAFGLGSMQLVYNDSRRFGMIYICSNNELKLQKYMKNMGPEPFDKEFNGQYLFNRFKNKKMPIKTAIMNNRLVVGIGNIYASESLFLSKINPMCQTRNLTRDQVETLRIAIINVLDEAIKNGGTTLRDFVNGDNKPGYFKQKLMVYDRKGMPCSICQTEIIKIVQSGRATYFCPLCQTLK